MAIIDAWDLPGGEGDYITLPNSVALDPLGALGHFRTGTGYNAWTVGIVHNLDDVNQATRATLWASQRASNWAQNHNLTFDPTGDDYEYLYNASEVFQAALVSETNDTWVLSTLSFAGGTGSLTVRRIPLATATQSHSGTGASGGSTSSDSALQLVTLGAWYNGTNTQSEMNGQIALVLIVKGTELSQAQLEAFAADPLNAGDSLQSIYGANCFFWDNDGTDAVAGAVTLNGTVTRGTGNGPDIPARAAGGGVVSPMLLKNNLGKVLLR